MPTPINHLDDLERLERERDDADRTYNEALTALDRALQQHRDAIAVPPAFDESQVTPLNEQWSLPALPPSGGSRWARWLGEQIRKAVAPLFARQEAFNGTLVDHINRNAATHREAVQTLSTLVEAFHDEHQRLVSLQSKLILFAQQITPYVDTRDRAGIGQIRRDLRGSSALGDEVRKRWESIHTSLGVLHRSTQTLKHAFEREFGETAGGTARSGERSADGPAAERGDPGALKARLNAYKYVAFEDQFRGPEEQIRERLAAYVPLFTGCRDVLDLGCGRGEFLDLLREAGVPASGVDVNQEMVDACRDRGLEAAAGDALGALSARADGTLGGIFAAQVVEHLPADYLLELIEVAYQKLRPGGKIVLETINPTCWHAFFTSYVRDFTHVHPLHPETLEYLLAASGFQKLEVRYSAPVPDHVKLQPVEMTGGAPGASEASLVEMAAVVNDNVQKLNGFLFTYFDYAAIGERV